MIEFIIKLSLTYTRELISSWKVNVVISCITFFEEEGILQLLFKKSYASGIVTGRNPRISKN